MVPAYCTTRAGRVFRLIRSSEPIDRAITRYRLRAVPVAAAAPATDREVTADLDAALQLDKLRHGQAVPTPETVFESLWSQLQVDLDLGRA